MLKFKFRVRFKVRSRSKKVGQKSGHRQETVQKSPNFKVDKSRQTMHVLWSVLSQESDASVILGLRGHLRSQNRGQIFRARKLWCFFSSPRQSIRARDLKLGTHMLQLMFLYIYSGFLKIPKIFENFQKFPKKYDFSKYFSKNPKF